MYWYNVLTGQTADEDEVLDESDDEGAEFVEEVVEEEATLRFSPGSSLARRANASSTTESARMTLIARSLMMRLSSILMRGWDDGLDLAVRHVQSWSWSTSP